MTKRILHFLRYTQNSCFFFTLHTVKKNNYENSHIFGDSIFILYEWSSHCFLSPNICKKNRYYNVQKQLMVIGQSSFLISILPAISNVMIVVVLLRLCRQAWETGERSYQTRCVWLSTGMLNFKSNQSSENTTHTNYWGQQSRFNLTWQLHCSTEQLLKTKNENRMENTDNEDIWQQRFVPCRHGWPITIEHLK